MEVSNYDIMHIAMCNVYNEIKNDGYIMDGLENEQKLDILEYYLLPYFEKYEFYEICEELKNEILKIK